MNVSLVFISASVFVNGHGVIKYRYWWKYSPDYNFQIISLKSPIVNLTPRKFRDHTKEAYAYAFIKRPIIPLDRS